MSYGNINAALDYFTDLLKAHRRRMAYQHAYSAHYPVINPPLLASDPNNQSRRFTFRFPSGWQEMSPEERNNFGNWMGATVAAGVSDVRDDLLTTRFVVIDEGFPEHPERFVYILGAPENVLRAQAQRFRGTALAPPSRLMLDGQRAIFYSFAFQGPGHPYGQAEDIALVQSEVYVAVGPQIFRILFGGPAAFHSALLPAFWTMLGTWQWSGQSPGQP